MYPLLPLIFMGAYLFVGISITIQTPKIAVIGLSVLTGFMIIYFIAKQFRNRSVKSE
jgi:APA family basic amino acid/polyamine antiporter